MVPGAGRNAPGAGWGVTRRELPAYGTIANGSALEETKVLHEKHCHPGRTQRRHRPEMIHGGVLEEVYSCGEKRELPWRGGGRRRPQADALHENR